ncbi:MAG TPA: glycosyltransferase family 4 protein [Candidatus Sulfotelmatobacter sp.]|nr:glycosyltransferase family 4 protein [Candidatus Sulfotelmatobacter sp.]
MTVRIFVPRWMDQENTNAQNANARALLSRFSDPRARWTAVRSRESAPSVRQKNIYILPVSSTRFWHHRLALAYQSRFDAIFYPGHDWADELGIKMRRFARRRIPLIATMEGIIASSDALRHVSELVGHPVFSQPGTDPGIPRIRGLYEASDHIIAVSPFLARVSNALYGNKVSYLPLGIETGIFHDSGRCEPERVRVVSCGTVKGSKSPDAFLRLAARYKQADFVWFGDGVQRESLIVEAKRLGLENLNFPGALPPERLAEEFRRSSLFILPSHAEGVPKVTQEAAACGLPIVLFGFYEAPTVVHEANGLVAWSDDEFIEHVGSLIDNPMIRQAMGERGAAMAKHWSWDHLAPRWEQLIIRLASSC